MPPKTIVSLLAGAGVISICLSAGLARAGGGSVSSPVQVSLRILPASASPAPRPARKVPVTVPAGTAVTLRIVDRLPPSQEGTVVARRFLMEVARPLTVGGLVAVPAHTPAEGELMPAPASRKSVPQIAQANWLLLDNQSVPLSGQFAYSGSSPDGTIEAVMLQDMTIIVDAPVASE
ncbi:MAG: hypothetical protein ACR2PC_10700 [Tsuneonella suprasediminis]|nr:hypothetical protein LBX01_06460 [Altererythrobacter sp. N1]